LGVKKNVGGFEVSMDDWNLRMLMQVLQPSVIAATSHIEQGTM
jgi:hypothetical protein